MLTFQFLSLIYEIFAQDRYVSFLLYSKKLLILGLHLIPTSRWEQQDHLNS